MGAPALIAAAAVSLYSTNKQIEAQKDAQAAQERQAAAEQRRAEIQNLRSVRQQIRQSRIAQASMVNQAALSGGTGGSAVAGGVASVGSQLAGNLNYMGQIAEQNTAIGTAALQGAQAQSEATIWGAVGKLSSNVYGDLGGSKELGKVIG